MSSLGEWPNAHSAGSRAGFWESVQYVSGHATLNDTARRHTNDSACDYDKHAFIGKLPNHRIGYINEKTRAGHLMSLSL